MSTETPATSYTFTVFTGTRNRAQTLPRVYESLKAQTYRDFEWLIIDNESTDGTPELVAGWQADAPFPIRYFWQEDAGKHGSLNRAASLARGELFVSLDSDDSCLPTTLERLKGHWDSIPSDIRHEYSGVTGLCVDEHGRLVGLPFPSDPFDSNTLEIRYRHNITGEKWGFQRTDVLREFPYPAPAGYRGVIPASVVWAAMGRKYKTRFVNDPLHIYWQDQPVSLSRPMRLTEDAYGRVLENQSALNDDIDYLTLAPMAFLRAAINYGRWSFHQSQGLGAQWNGLLNPRARLLWAATIPLGWIVFNLDHHGLPLHAQRVRALLSRRIGR